MGRIVASSTRCVRGRVTACTTASATSWARIIPGRSASSGERPRRRPWRTRSRRPRCDRRAAHAAPVQLVVERAHEADLGELGGRVDGLALGRALPGDRGDHDEVGGRALEQVRQGGAHGVEEALDVDVDHLLEMLAGDVEEVAVGPDAGVRDEDVEPPEALDGLGHEALDLLRVAHVARARERTGDALVAAAARRQRHLGALLGERPARSRRRCRCWPR